MVKHSMFTAVPLDRLLPDTQNTESISPARSEFHIQTSILQSSYLEHLLHEKQQMTERGVSGGDISNIPPPLKYEGGNDFPN